MIYPRVSLYALMLAAAGIPLYIHLPRFASVELGISLGAVGTVLLLIRLVDLVQDPLIGWAIDHWPRGQVAFAMAAALGLAIGFPVLFLLPAGPFAAYWLTLVLVLLFTAYSLGSILLYGRSATLAGRADSKALMAVSAWREVGMLAGVVLAAIAPAVLAAMGAARQGYAAFGLLLGGLSLVIALVTLPMWRRPAITGESLSFSALAQAGALRLLFLALVNGLPVAITSTLFLFFVEDRLQLAGWAGPFLVLFFVMAGVSVPLWTWAAKGIGNRLVLMIAMPLAIAGFVGAVFLGPGNALGFAAVCIASGVALGADMVVLPAMFLIALTRSGLAASTAFGFWAFAGKLGLALAAFTVLPMLQGAGFQPGQTNTPAALSALTFAYAILPCLLKLLAFGLVLALPRETPHQPPA